MFSVAWEAQIHFYPHRTKVQLLAGDKVKVIAEALVVQYSVLSQGKHKQFNSCYVYGTFKVTDIKNW